MTNSEAIEAVQRGERVKGPYSIHAEVKGPPCPGFNCNWRTLFCDNTQDVVECSRCGRQAVTVCNFDEEYS